MSDKPAPEGQPADDQPDIPPQTGPETPSEHTPPEYPQPNPATEERVDFPEPPKTAAYRQKVEGMKKAREMMLRKREERQARLREMIARSDAAKAPIGAPIGAPMTAGRAEPTREPSLPDSHIPTRRRREERAVNGTDILPWEKKPGWDYQWMPLRILNQPVDRSTLRSYEDYGGWRPVLARDMPSRADRNAPPDTPVEMEAAGLYTRPMSLTMEAKQEDEDMAYRQQHDRMIAAASGQSAIRGQEGMPKRRGVKTVPVEISIVGEAG